MYNFFLIYKVFHIFVVTFLRKLMKKDIGIFIVVWVAVLSTATSFAQTDNNAENRALSHHKKYEFEQAINIYKSLLDKCSDSLMRISLENKIIQSENGLSLLDFAFEPETVTKKEFAKKDFFLHYPGFDNGSWIMLPKQLSPDTLAISAGEFPVIFFPNNANKLFFSAPDNSGSWNIYFSQLLNDTLWSAPKILNENVTSAGNEIFPMLSSNGKSLYFSSNGHYGVGGYDLYESKWDEELGDWGIPQNMGFPYSSPDDDFLFYNTPDGFYSLFASNRNCAADSLVVYVLEFENVPLKKRVTPAEALRISLLESNNGKKAETAPVQELNDSNNDYSQYTVAVNKVRDLQKKMKDAINRQDANRVLYNTLTNPDDLKALEIKIAQQEVEMLSLQNETNAAVSALQQLEMDFLAKGIFIPEVEPQTGADEESGEDSAGVFAFANGKMGMAPAMNVEIPELEVDLSFKITNEDAVIVDINDFPDGLVYQIQLFTLSKKASLKALKGLSPVFERGNASGRYVYSVGTFRKYNDALSNLNKVRKRGFPSALITAYKDGKTINVKNARALEKNIAESAVYQVTITGYAESLPQEVLAVIRATTEKDIAKTADGGTIKYVVGPFGREDDARLLVVALKAVSDRQIDVEKVEK